MCLLAARPLHGLQGDGAAATSAFTILSGGRAIGSLTTVVSRTAQGWSISARESLGAPFDLTATRFLARYSSNWHPIDLVIDGTQGTQAMRLSTSVSGTTAHSEGIWHGQRVDVDHQVAPDAVLLATDLFPTYEALAGRLSSAAAGSTFRLYVAPQGEIEAVVTRTIPHRLVTPSGTTDLREFDLTLANPGAPLAVEVWIDAHQRLARLAVPASWLVVIRDDISSVMAREERVSRPGDQDVFIPALGFSLSATMSTPSAASGPAPAVVLIGGPGRQDRDEVTDDIPVFGLLANALADAGFVVVRYDKRGVGRSGGRVESATLDDYATDALNVVEWLRKRPDVDRDRIALVGYAEGAATALRAAAREKHVAALCLVAAAGQTGREVTLMQQQNLLARSGEPEADKRARMTLQEHVIDAVIKGTGWAGIPPAVRRQAETPWFRSWLLFDPADAMKKVKQPLLIVSGAADGAFPPAQADRLEALARARKKLPESATRKIIAPGVDHQLVATGGGPGEHASPAGTSISPAVSSAIADWLEASLTTTK